MPGSDTAKSATVNANYSRLPYGMLLDGRNYRVKSAWITEQPSLFVSCYGCKTERRDKGVSRAPGMRHGHAQCEPI